MSVLKKDKEREIYEYVVKKLNYKEVKPKTRKENK